MEQKKKFLIVEDNEINRDLMSLLMEKIGYTYEEAINGQEAVDRSLKIPFDLILMDLEMPEMNGFDATKKIREVGNPSKHAIIIALTASTSQEDVDACKAVGMNDFLSKPIKKAELQNILDKWLK